MYKLDNNKDRRLSRLLCHATESNVLCEEPAVTDERHTIPRDGKSPPSRNSTWVILMRAFPETGNPCFARRSVWPSGPIQNEKKNAQVENPYGREKALQQDWHRQNQAAPDQDAPYPFV